MVNTPLHNTVFTRTTPVAKSAAAAKSPVEALPAEAELELALGSLAAHAAAEAPKSPILQSPVDKSAAVGAPAETRAPGSNLFARFAINTERRAGLSVAAASGGESSSSADASGAGSSGAGSSGAGSSGGKPSGGKSSRGPNPRHRRIYVSARLKQAREEMSACRSQMQTRPAPGKPAKSEAAHRDMVFARVRFQEIRKEIAALRVELKAFKGPGKAATPAAAVS